MFKILYNSKNIAYCEIFGKRYSNKMTKFLLIVHFHDIKDYQSISLFLNSVSNMQYTIMHIVYKIFKIFWQMPSSVFFLQMSKIYIFINTK